MSQGMAAGAAMKELVLTRIFDAPRSLVFKCWTDPKHFAQWWGPHSYTNPVCELDVHPGGAIRVDMAGPEGTFPMGGTFHEIIEPERLVFTTTAFHDGTGNPLLEVLNTVTFAEHGSQTLVTLHARVVKCAPEIAHCLAGMAQGWTESLERLGDVAARPNDTTPLVAREIVIRRLINAPRELVFDAWTNAEHIGNWWGPEGFTTTTYAMDVRPGGVWDFVMHGPDGRDYKNKITYTDVVKPERLAYKHAGEGADGGVRFLSTVTLGEMFGQTSLALRMVFESAEEREQNVKKYHSIEGGKQTLARLAQHVEKPRPS